MKHKAKTSALHRMREYVLAGSCILFSVSTYAQAPSEHASHHPAAAATDATTTQIAGAAILGTAPGSDAPATQAPSAIPGAPMPLGGAEMMGEMMRQMGVPPRKELYPALMELENLTLATRVQFEALARERMASGAAQMSWGLEQLNLSATTLDVPKMQAATAQMKQGVSQFDSGIAALSAISSDPAPRAVALEWFKSNMNLLPPPDMQVPHGVFGLSGFHYFTMFILFAVAAAMIWASVKKMQRAQTLVARLAGNNPESALPAKTLLCAVQVPPPALHLDDAPSLSNSWTGLMRVVRIFDETPNVRTLRLADLAGGTVAFRHLPGQFVTFTVQPNDQLVKRSYTIASSPTHREYVEVTVKREERGTVSSFLHNVHEGDTLQTTGPSGNFTFLGHAANNVVLISGGVGITPMMSVVRYLTDRSWSGDIFFIFGCRGEQDVIYREELEYLQRRYPNLHLSITAMEVQSAHWPYAKGAITKELLIAAVPHIGTRRVHLCGPKPMMDALKPMLAELGVPAEQIRSEIFIGKEHPSAEPAVPATDANQLDNGRPPPEGVAATGIAVATFARSKRTALLAADKTVLEASEAVGVNIDYSCRVGTCGVCKVRLLEGTVTMEIQDALDMGDKQNNIILACQAKSTRDVTVDA